MADRHSIYKHAAKEIAWQHGQAVTFMAKWDERYAGSSCHIHVSLWDEDGKKPLSRATSRSARSSARATFRWFLGGWMAHIRELFAVLRAVSVVVQALRRRLVRADRHRLELRQPHRRLPHRRPRLRRCGSNAATAGADANVYLAFAATLAAGLDGIANQIEPPDGFEGDVYAAQRSAARAALAQRSDRRARSRARSRATRSATTSIEHYLHFFRTEQRKFDAVVTDWERRRYFEQA